MGTRVYVYPVGNDPKYSDRVGENTIWYPCVLPSSDTNGHVYQAIAPEVDPDLVLYALMKRTDIDETLYLARTEPRSFVWEEIADEIAIHQSMLNPSTFELLYAFGSRTKSYLACFIISSDTGVWLINVCGQVWNTTQVYPSEQEFANPGTVRQGADDKIYFMVQNDTYDARMMIYEPTNSGWIKSNEISFDFDSSQLFPNMVDLPADFYTDCASFPLGNASTSGSMGGIRCIDSSNKKIFLKPFGVSTWNCDGPMTAQPSQDPTGDWDACDYVNEPDNHHWTLNQIPPFCTAYVAYEDQVIFKYAMYDMNTNQFLCAHPMGSWKHNDTLEICSQILYKWEFDPVEIYRNYTPLASMEDIEQYGIPTGDEGWCFAQDVDSNSIVVNWTPSGRYKKATFPSSYWSSGSYIGVVKKYFYGSSTGIVFAYSGVDESLLMLDLSADPENGTWIDLQPTGICDLPENRVSGYVTNIIIKTIGDPTTGIVSLNGCTFDVSKVYDWGTINVLPGDKAAFANGIESGIDYTHSRHYIDLYQGRSQIHLPTFDPDIPPPEGSTIIYDASTGGWIISYRDEAITKIMASRSLT